MFRSINGELKVQRERFSEVEPVEGLSVRGEDRMLSRRAERRHNFKEKNISMVFFPFFYEE